MVSIVYDNLFKIFLGVLAVGVISLLILKFTKVDLPLPKSNNTELQTLVIKSDLDMAKAIYSCYSISNFGVSKKPLNCFILKIESDIDWDYVKEMLKKKGISEKAYETKELYGGDVAILYYDGSIIRIKKIWNIIFVHYLRKKLKE